MSSTRDSAAKGHLTNALVQSAQPERKKRGAAEDAPKPARSRAKSANPRHDHEDIDIAEAPVAAPRISEFTGKRAPWTREEDEMVIRLVAATDGRTWSNSALLPPGRTPKQCRERYHNHLDPHNNCKDAWSEEEDRTLLEAHDRFGNKWSAIATMLPGRSDNTVKNHWNARFKKKHGEYCSAHGIEPTNMADGGVARQEVSTRGRVAQT